MGQIRTPECDRIDAILREMFPGRYDSECCQDTYTQDYILWLNANDEIRPLRITLEEYTNEDWPSHVRQVMEERPVEDDPSA